MKTIQPKTYRRTDIGGNRRIGYIAQDSDGEVGFDMQNIVDSFEDEENDRTLLSLDYSRIAVVLHGALKKALQRIEALENTVATMSGGSN